MLLAGFWSPSFVGRAKDKIDEKKLSSWKLLDDFRRRLANAQTAVPAREKRPGGPERLLLEELRQLGISFVFRIRNKPRMEIVEDLPLTERGHAVRRRHIDANGTTDSYSHRRDELPIHPRKSIFLQAHLTNLGFSSW